MCHGWRRTRGSPLFSVCTHNKIDDFWRGKGRGAGGRLGAADLRIPVSLAWGAVTDFPGAHLQVWREMERGQRKGRGKREQMSLCPSSGLASCLGPELSRGVWVPGPGMLLCPYSYPRNQKRLMLSPCWIGALTPEHVVELHHPQSLPHAGSRQGALLRLKLSPGQKERASPANL